MSPRRTRRRLFQLIALPWIVVGLLGTTSYLRAYDQHRGFPTLHRRRGVAAGRQLWIHFYSPALRRRADYIVYEPTGFTRGRRYPVLYLLHGSPGRPQTFIDIANIDVRIDNLIARRRMRPMLLVFPDGRINGSQFSDSEWANTGTGRYEGYILDVVRDVDRRFPTLRQRRDRVIGGYSAGSLGALNAVLHYPQYFGGVEAWSGPFVEDRSSAVFAHESNALIFFYSPYRFAGTIARYLRRYPLRAFIYCGRGDHDRREIPGLARALRAGGAVVQTAIYPGGHDWQLWNAHISQMLLVASEFITHPAPRPVRYPRHHRRHRRPRGRSGRARRAGSQ